MEIPALLPSLNGGSSPACCLPHLRVLPLAYTEPLEAGAGFQAAELEARMPGAGGKTGKTVLSPRPLRLAGGGAALAWPDSSLGFLVAPPDTPLPHVTLSLAGHTAVRPAAEGRASSLDLVWEHLPEEMTG